MHPTLKIPAHAHTITAAVGDGTLPASRKPVRTNLRTSPIHTHRGIRFDTLSLCRVEPPCYYRRLSNPAHCIKRFFCVSAPDAHRAAHLISGPKVYLRYKNLEEQIANVHRSSRLSQRKALLGENSPGIVVRVAAVAVA